jgi:peroxiredoxin
MRRNRLFFVACLAMTSLGAGFARAGETAVPLAIEKPAQKPPPKPADKPGAKAPAKKPPEKPPEKPADKPAAAKTFAIGGEVDPLVSVTDLSGKTESLKDLHGKIVVVQFWSMSSNAYDKRLAALAGQYTSKNVAFLAIDADKPDAEDAKKLGDYVAKSGITFPVAIDKDGKLADRFGATTSSHAFVIDAKGVLRYSGAIDDDPKGEKGDKAMHYLQGALDALIAGKDVPTPTTTPNGTRFPGVPPPRTRRSPTSPRREIGARGRWNRPPGPAKGPPAARNILDRIIRVRIKGPMFRGRARESLVLEELADSASPSSSSSTAAAGRKNRTAAAILQDAPRGLLPRRAGAREGQPARVPRRAAGGHRRSDRGEHRLPRLDRPR